jgi:hypothetical protein
MRLKQVSMRLAEFIPGAMDDILAEWEAFAGTLLPSGQSGRGRAHDGPRR